jgi:hypothetical protein
MRVTPPPFFLELTTRQEELPIPPPKCEKLPPTRAGRVVIQRGNELPDSATLGGLLILLAGISIVASAFLSMP